MGCSSVFVACRSGSNYINDNGITFEMGQRQIRHYQRDDYLQIAFSHEFSLPVAKLVSFSLDTAAVMGNFVVSPKMHNNARMLLASILLCVRVTVKRSRGLPAVHFPSLRARFFLLY